MHPTFPLDGMGDEVPRNRRQPDLGTRRQMSNLRVEEGRVASSTVDSFTQMTSKQGGNSGLPWKTARCDHNLPRGKWGGGFGG